MRYASKHLRGVRPDMLLALGKHTAGHLEMGLACTKSSLQRTKRKCLQLISAFLKPFERYYQAAC